MAPGRQLTTRRRLAYPLGQRAVVTVDRGGNPLESPERAYGRAAVAFVFIVATNFVVLFGLMALGLWQGLKITW